MREKNQKLSTFLIKKKEKKSKHVLTQLMIILPVCPQA